MKNFIKSAFDVEGDLEYTTDHHMIRSWVGRWHGHPALAKSADTTEAGSGSLLRIKFPKDPNEKSLESISWDEFFEHFEQEHLALEYLDEPKSNVTGEPFARLVDRRTVGADSQVLASLSPEEPTKTEESPAQDGAPIDRDADR